MTNPERDPDELVLGPCETAERVEVLLAERDGAPPAERDGAPPAAQERQ